MCFSSKLRTLNSQVYYRTYGDSDKHRQLGIPLEIHYFPESRELVIVWILDFYIDKWFRF